MKMNMWQKLKAMFQYPLVVVFTVFMLGLFVVDLITPPKAFSALENRNLQQRPAFSLSALVGNIYTLKYEEFTNDQFVARDAWINLKSRSEYALARTENNNVIFGKDGYLFDKYTKVDEKRLQNNTEFVNDFAQNYDENVTLALVPSAADILTDKRPAGMPHADQLAGISDIYATLTAPNIRCIDVAAALQPATSDYIYYRTDHHWTSYGAYLAYVEYAKSRGLTPVPLDMLKQYQSEVPDFLGTNYSKAKAFNPVPDVITWYDIPVESVRIDGESAPGLYDIAQFAARDKYAALLRGNNGITVITSQNNINHTDGKVSRVLLVKDSYGNSFAPYLTYNYDEVYVVDLRSMGGLQPLLKEVTFDDVLLLYSFYNFTTDTNLPKLRYEQ